MPHTYAPSRPPPPLCPSHLLRPLTSHMKVKVQERGLSFQEMHSHGTLPPPRVCPRKRSWWHPLCLLCQQDEDPEGKTPFRCPEPACWAGLPRSVMSHHYPGALSATGLVTVPPGASREVAGEGAEAGREKDRNLERAGAYTPIHTPSRVANRDKSHQWEKTPPRKHRFQARGSTRVCSLHREGELLNAGHVVLHVTIQDRSPPEHNLRRGKPSSSSRCLRATCPRFLPLRGLTPGDR